MTKIQNENRDLKFLSRHESHSKYEALENLNFDIVSDFEFRVSDFLTIKVR